MRRGINYGTELGRQSKSMCLEVVQQIPGWSTLLSSRHSGLPSFALRKPALMFVERCLKSRRMDWLIH